MPSALIRECIGSSQTLTTQATASAVSASNITESIIPLVLEHVLDLVSVGENLTATSWTYATDTIRSAEAAAGRTDVLAEVLSTSLGKDSVLIIDNGHTVDIASVAETVTFFQTQNITESAASATAAAEAVSTPSLHVSVADSIKAITTVATGSSTLVHDTALCSEQAISVGVVHAKDLIDAVDTAVGLELARITDMIQASETVLIGNRQAAAACVSRAG